MVEIPVRENEILSSWGNINLSCENEVRTIVNSRERDFSQCNGNEMLTSVALRYG